MTHKLLKQPRQKKSAPKARHRWAVAGLTCLCLLLAGVIAVFSINGAVRHVGGALLRTPEEAAENPADCILVLGCYVHENGHPSAMLGDRLRRGIQLYKAGAAPKILMSGDHGRTDYDEVNAMKQTAMASGVPSEDVFMDHAGFSTYESLYRARDIFGAGKIIIVSQEYHLYRALYIARQLGLEAVGVSADYQRYTKETHREIREILARNKDFFTSLFQPKPTYLGDPIPLTGSGDVTAG